MPLTDQLTSLRLSKRMKEIGFKQESYFRHVRLSDKPDGSDHWMIRHEFMSAYEEYSAYSVAELGMMLPSQIKIPLDKNKKFYGIEDDDVQYLHFEFRKRVNGKWTISVRRKCGGNISKSEYTISNQDNECDARAKCLIYLRENSLI